MIEIVHDQNFLNGDVVLSVYAASRDRDKETVLSQFQQLLAHPTLSLAWYIHEDQVIAYFLFEHDHLYRFFILPDYQDTEVEVIAFRAVVDHIITNFNHFSTDLDLSRGIEAILPELKLEGYVRYEMRLQRESFISWLESYSSDVFSFDTTRTKITAEQPLEGQDSYAIHLWEDTMLETYAPVLIDGNSTSVDALLFPNFQTLEGATKVLQDFLKGKYGPVREEMNTMLMHQEKIIGACFTAYIEQRQQIFILEIAINSKYQGKGLGRAFFALSLLHIFNSAPEVTNIGLAVTKKNAPALRLYESMGFEIINEGVTYVYIT